MFVNAEQFPFLQGLKSHWTAIRDEYLSLPKQSFDPWVQQQMHGEGWSVYGLYALGKAIPAACSSCPVTADILAKLPGVSLAGFSLLAPQTRIEPHVGWAKSVYRLHLGLVVPPDCALKVGGEVKSWREGEILIFDDTVEHEAWNQSREYRATLMVDFLRPGVSHFSNDDIPEAVRRYAEGLFKSS